MCRACGNELAALLIETSMHHGSVVFLDGFPVVLDFQLDGFAFGEDEQA